MKVKSKTYPLLKFYMGEGDYLVQLWAIPSHIPTQIHLNESPTHTPTIFVHTFPFCFLLRQCSSCPDSTCTIPLSHSLCPITPLSQDSVATTKTWVVFLPLSPRRWGRGLDGILHTVRWGNWPLKVDDLPTRCTGWVSSVNNPNRASPDSLCWCLQSQYK